MPLTPRKATVYPCLHWRLLDTQASLAQSLVGSLLQFVGLSALWLYGGAHTTCFPGLLLPESLSPLQATAHTLKGKSGSVSCGVPGSWHAQGFVSALRAPLEGMGFDSKCDFSPPTLFEASPLPLDAVSFLGRLHHSPVSGCSAVRCDLGVLRGEDTRTSFYSAIFWVPAFPHLSVIREVQIQMVYHE